MSLSQVKFDRLVLCEPINKQAYLVTLQSGCDEVYKPVSTEELVQIFARLCRKQRAWAASGRCGQALHVDDRPPERLLVEEVGRRVRDLVGRAVEGVRAAAQPA